jgi:hypothetical protein
MASVEKRAADYLRWTKSSQPVPYSHGKPATSSGNPVETVAALNKGVLHGPTARGN